MKRRDLIVDGCEYPIIDAGEGLLAALHPVTMGIVAAAKTRGGLVAAVRTAPLRPRPAVDNSGDNQPVTYTEVPGQVEP